MAKTDQNDGKLRRTIGPAQLTLYGLGSMLGAGIYGLIGTAAGQVGNALWLAFIFALVAALLTALSYASLGSRYPRAGGAAYVTQRAFGMPMLSFVIGLALVLAGIASVATQSRVFAGIVMDLLGTETLPLWLFAVGFLTVLGGIVFAGIRESLWVNVLCTVVEATGLLIIIAVGMSYWGSVDYFETPAESGFDFTVLVIQGAILTFFAFIGFEDTINVAEECKNPEVTLPVGIIAATSIAALIYIAVAISAVSVVPPDELSEAAAPLTEVIARAAPAIPPILFTAMTLFAVANTALVNYVTSSRLVYGMAQQKLLPERLGDVHDRTKTPHLAVALLFIILVPLALTGTVGELAAATVLLLLTVFTVVNAALVVLKRRRGEKPGRFEVPLFVPLLGAIVCAVLIAARIASSDWHAPAIAGSLLVAILALYAALRPGSNAATA